MKDERSKNVTLRLQVRRLGGRYAADRSCHRMPLRRLEVPVSKDPFSRSQLAGGVPSKPSSQRCPDEGAAGYCAVKNPGVDGLCSTRPTRRPKNHNPRELQPTARFQLSTEVGAAVMTPSLLISTGSQCGDKIPRAKAGADDARRCSAETRLQNRCVAGDDGTTALIHTQTVRTH